MPDSRKSLDLRDCPTAFECRDRLPELGAWMSDENLKLVPIYKGASFEAGHEYFDLNNPDRGAFVADGTEGWITDHTYACRDEVPEEIWAQLVTWRQPVSEDQGRAIEMTTEDFGTPEETSAAGREPPIPRSIT